MLDIFVFNFKEIMCTFLKKKKTRSINYVSAGISTSKCLLNAHEMPDYYVANPTENIYLLTSKSASCSKHKAGLMLRSKICFSDRDNPWTLTDSSCGQCCFGDGKGVAERGCPPASPVGTFRSRSNSPHGLLCTMLWEARKVTYFSGKTLKASNNLTVNI